MDKIQIPITFEDIVKEITAHSGLPNEEVSRRVWMEALVPGWNVVRDCVDQGITPHVYDGYMEQFYRNSESFVFETMVYWAKPERREWTQAAYNRILKYSDENQIETNDVKILMLGDGSGNDSIYLSNGGCKIDYFDVPGSKIFNFAKNRFARNGILNRSVCMKEEYEKIGFGEYDFVVCFEVLEHLNDLLATISQIVKFLKLGGYALITEDFSGISHAYPTHLKKNAHYYGKTPMLFQKHGMKLTWYNETPLFKPMEFRRQNGCHFSEKCEIFYDYKIVKKYLWGCVRRFR